MGQMRVEGHGYVLRERGLVLRALTEDDWDVVVKWNRDPAVLYFAEGADAPVRSAEEIKKIYRTVAMYGYIFIAEVKGRPIGDGWIERMNVRRIVNRYPEWETWRLDLAIGERDYWGRGYGTRMIGALTRFCFERTCADAVFACYIADHNARSRRAFEKNGYIVDRKVKVKSGVVYDMMKARNSG